MGSYHNNMVRNTMCATKCTSEMNSAQISNSDEGEPYGLILKVFYRELAIPCAVSSIFVHGLSIFILYNLILFSRNISIFEK